MVAENLMPIPRHKALFSTVEQVQVGAFKVVQKEGGNSAKAVEGPLGRYVSTSHNTREARLQVINPASEKLDCKRVLMTSRIITGDAFESSEVCSFCHLLFAFHKAPTSIPVTSSSEDGGYFYYQYPITYIMDKNKQKPLIPLWALVIGPLWYVILLAYFLVRVFVFFVWVTPAMLAASVFNWQMPNGLVPDLDDLEM